MAELDAAGPPDATPNLAAPSLAALAAAPGPRQPQAVALAERFVALAKRADDLSAGMDFSFLYNTERELFVRGYHLAAQQLDNSFYDLLSSEARLASFVAIAYRQIPARHWFRLGRSLAWAGGSLVSLSWSGTMFEYLMPSLLMQDYPNSLVAQTNHAVVREQQAYGARHQVPWGVSESGFYAFDHQFNYQYQAFGVPSLGLKRELAENVVIAPYATFLAMHIDPPAAWANLQALARQVQAGQAFVDDRQLWLLRGGGLHPGPPPARRAGRAGALLHGPSSGHEPGCPRQLFV